MPEGVIEAVGDGYRLGAAGIDLDADRLPSLLDGAMADGAALAELDALLARWSGPAYPELDEIDDGRAEAARLEELRIRSVEVRAERRLTFGDTDGLVADLMALADEQSLRERPRALLMAALAAAGRQADALRVYDDFRRLLGDELGIEPSPALAGAACRPAGGNRRGHVGAGEPAADAGDLDHRPRGAGGRRDPGGRRRPAGDARRSRRGRQDPAAHRGRAPAPGRTAGSPGGAVRAGDLRRGVGRRCGGRGAGGRRPSWRIPRRPRRRRPGRGRDRAARRQLRARARYDRGARGAAARRCPNVRVVATSRERLRVGGEQRPPCPRCPPATRTHRRCCCSWSGHGRSCPASIRRGGARLRRRDRAAAGRPAPGHRAGRRPSPHPRARGGGRGPRPAVRAAVVGLPQLGAARVARRRRVVVVRVARRGPPADVRGSVGVLGFVRRRRRRRGLRR